MILHCTFCGKPKEIAPYRKNTFRFCSYKCEHFAMIGRIPWNKGMKYSFDQKAKLNMAGLTIGQQMGKGKHHKWQGDFCGYNAIHKWLVNKVGKATYCSKNENHKSTRYHWANISGEYKRDISDYMQLCPSCHMKHDKTGEKSWKKRKEVVL